MLKIFFNLLMVFLIVIGFYVHCNSQKTFEAKFKNIDGLPKGAKVTVLGVEIGKVIKTKPVKDGIIVTVRITKKSFPIPEPGSQLTITSFSPGQGRVLEVIPPSDSLIENKAWIIQEPITTGSWLYASLELLDRLKSFSKDIVKYVTPENFNKARAAFLEASNSLRETADNLRKHENDLNLLKGRFTTKTDETKELLLKLHKPIQSLSQIVSDKGFVSSLKGQLTDFTGDLNEISKSISTPEFVNNIANFKVEILDKLNKINLFLTSASQKLNNPSLRQKIKDFNNHLVHLNAFYDELNKKDIKSISTKAVKKAREVTTKASEVTQN